MSLTLSKHYQSLDEDEAELFTRRMDLWAEVLAPGEESLKSDVHSVLLEAAFPTPKSVVVVETPEATAIKVRDRRVFSDGNDAVTAERWLRAVTQLVRAGHIECVAGGVYDCTPLGTLFANRLRQASSIQALPPDIHSKLLLKNRDSLCPGGIATDAPPKDRRRSDNHVSFVNELREPRFQERRQS